MSDSPPTSEQPNIFVLAQQHLAKQGITVDPESVPDPDTMSMLDVVETKNGIRVKPHLNNIRLILTHDPRWKGKIRYNELRGQAEIRGQAVTDTHETMIACRLPYIYGLKATEKAISSILRLVASENRFHPVVDYLDALEWDGKPRVDHLLSRYFGAADSDLNRILSRRFLISAIARARKMGSKVDCVLILIGPQGARKSSGLRALCGDEWFADTVLSLSSKDGLESLRGVWIYELAELDSLKKAEMSRTKAYLAAQVDHYRASYGRNPEDRPRGCVFVGSTNEAQFLTDPTGHRRYWCCKVGSIDLDSIDTDRDQLWAEADTYYRGGEQWWLSPAEEALRVNAAEEHEVVDPWRETISEFLTPRLHPVTMSEVLDHLDLDSARRTMGASRRVGAILRQLGREKARERRNGIRVKVWARTTKGG